MVATEYKQIDEVLSTWLNARFREVFPEAEIGENIGRVIPSANPAFGDFQCNDAMALSKVLKQPPRNIAAKVVEGLELPSMISKLEIAGPGFINITISSDFIAESLLAMAAAEKCGIPQCGVGHTVVIDYSSPNVAKPMHIGHIRSTVIGSAIDKLHRALGYNVIADNHLGDWGTQFGIIIMGYRNFVDKEKLASEPATELERCYVQSYARAKDDEEWMNRCREELVKLQQGDEENLALWKEFIRLSMIEFNRVFARLGVNFDLTRGESYYQPVLKSVVDRLEEAGLAKDSEGAKIVDLEAEKLGVCIVRKSDGGFNYATTDIATVESRVTEFNPEKIIYVTDERQQLHFKQFFNICRKMNIAPESTALEHVWFGLMRLPEGTFSTRQGNVIKLEALLDEAESRARKIISESRPDMPEDEAAKLAAKIGIGAVKYSDLSQDPRTMITFTWDKALSLDGNSGPYLQYAHARIRSVLEKYKAQFPELDYESYPIVLNEDIERSLALKLAMYPSAVKKAAQSYRPCVLADYLYELSQLYSSFYQRVPFLKAEEGVRESRIRICSIVAKVLSQGLGILGIEAPERI